MISMRACEGKQKVCGHAHNTENAGKNKSETARNRQEESARESQKIRERENERAREQESERILVLVWIGSVL